jgi:iron complex outermembrane recepter protein
MKKRLQFLSVVFTLAALTAYGQTVKGRVTAAQDNSALPGVSVVLKGTSVGTTTDSDGNYSLSVGAGDNAVLSFSFIGFTTQEVPVGGRTTVDVILAEDAQQLGEVVVTALGIAKEQKALGYAVSTVSGEQITASGNTNFASALYGKAAGVRISTAPGGATSAVNVQIRGVNSLKFNSQPLYVVDGILIRNSIQTSNPDKNSGINNSGYWDDQRIRGNGILDINPADIESLTVLKGASATALYGSEAASGVIVITTKKGTKGAGLGVDVNYVYNVEQVAFTPKFQNIYGPGYDRATNLANGATEDGWIPVDTNGDGVNDAQRPYFRAYGQFGPKMEGQLVPWWDGTMRNYSAQPDNYKEFYQTGYNSNFNVALSNSTDKYSYRFSYTRYDYEGISRGSEMKRNVFNLNTTLKLHEKLSADVVVNYNNSNVHNRPEQIERITHNYGGFFSRTDDMSVYLDKFQTSQGYKYVPYNLIDRNPAEALKYNIRAYDLMDYLWRNLKNSEDEIQDRLISSVTINYEIAKGLRLRGRVGNDLTSINIEKKEHNEYPIAFNGSSSTGNYRVSSGKYSVFYSDALLSYTKALNQDFEFSVNAGFQSRDEKYKDQSIGTDGGLVTENWFSLSNSTNLLNSSGSRVEVLKYAYLGTLNLSYKNFLFLEGTGRQEYSSTLPPGNNNFFYPSVNAGFVFTDAVELPAVLSYGKLRASYGVVGTSPPPYVANILYTPSTLPVTGGSVPSLTAQSAYGNNEIKPENKYESEFGLEVKLLENKIGFDIAYYNSRIVDQILPTTIPYSTGAASILSNIGELRSNGIEIAFNATPVSTGDLKWDTRFTFATSKTKAHKLANGSERLIMNKLDQDAVLIVADQGKTLGDIYVHPRLTDANGNYVIDADGYYTMDTDVNNYVKVGNILPKAIGGWSNTVSYKGFSLDFMIDYRFGGKLVSPPNLYAMGAGMYENTLQYRDEEHGGIPYYIDGNQKIQLPSHSSAAPNGGRVYHDGVILPGVTETGEPNTTVLDAPSYYLNTFTWGQTGLYEEGAVLKNDYVKMREAVLSYNLPRSISQKLKLQNVRVSLVGRNLFYIYRTLDNLDPEVAIGSQWNTQGIDEGSSAATRSYGFSIHASF